MASIYTSVDTGSSIESQPIVDTGSSKESQPIRTWLVMSCCADGTPVPVVIIDYNNTRGYIDNGDMANLSFLFNCLFFSDPEIT